nr:MAG TPA: hypothetical protein [Crassvirales sp.]
MVGVRQPPPTPSELAAAPQCVSFQFSFQEKFLVCVKSSFAAARCCRSSMLILLRIDVIYCREGG